MYRYRRKREGLWLIVRFLRRELPAIAALAALFAVGVGGYRAIEGMSFVEALYMTTIVVSTVGLFMGEQGALSSAGMLFTVGMILSGAAIAAYFVSAAGQLFSEGEWRAHWKQRRRTRMLDKLRGHVILCGFGRVGRHVAGELSREGAPFVVVDEDGEILEQASLKGYDALEGDATSEETLREAGVDRARCLVAALSSDADNVFIVLTARNMNPKLVISARANLETSEPKLLKAGADHVMSPYRIGAHRMVTRLMRPSVAAFLDDVMRADGLELFLEQVDIPEDSPLAGTTIAEADLRRQTGVTVLGYETPGRGYWTDLDATLQPGSRLIVLGTLEQLERFKNLASG